MSWHGWLTSALNSHVRRCLQAVVWWCRPYDIPALLLRMKNAGITSPAHDDCFQQATPELVALWDVGKQLWRRQSPSAAIAAFSWSPVVAGILHQVQGACVSPQLASLTHSAPQRTVSNSISPARAYSPPVHSVSLLHGAPDLFCLPLFCTHTPPTYHLSFPPPSPGRPQSKCFKESCPCCLARTPSCERTS